MESEGICESKEAIRFESVINDGNDLRKAVSKIAKDCVRPLVSLRDLTLGKDTQDRSRLWKIAKNYSDTVIFVARPILFPFGVIRTVFNTDLNFRGKVVTEVGQRCMIPFWYAQELPFQFVNYTKESSPIREDIKRVFSIVFGVPALGIVTPFAGVGAALTSIGSLLRTKTYQLDRGTFNQEVEGRKVLTFNFYARPGLTSVWNLEIPPARFRLDKYISFIRKSNSDIVFIPEVSPSIITELKSKLSDRYHYFFSNVGRRSVGIDPSFFIAFRGNLKGTSAFIPFKNQGFFKERGFFAFETEHSRYFCAYHPTLEDLKEICEQKMNGKSMTILGPLGFKRESASFKYLKEQGFTTPIKQELNQKQKMIETGSIFSKKFKGK